MKNLDIVLLFILGLIVWEMIDPGEMSGYAVALFRYFKSFI